MPVNPFRLTHPSIYTTLEYHCSYCGNYTQRIKRRRLPLHNIWNRSVYFPSREDRDNVVLPANTDCIHCDRPLCTKAEDAARLSLLTRNADRVREIPEPPPNDDAHRTRTLDALVYQVPQVATVPATGELLSRVNSRVDDETQEAVQAYEMSLLDNRRRQERVERWKAETQQMQSVNLSLTDLETLDAGSNESQGSEPGGEWKRLESIRAGESPGTLRAQDLELPDPFELPS